MFSILRLCAKLPVISIVTFLATWNSPGKLALNSIHDNYYENWKEKYNIELIAISLEDARKNSKVRPYVEGKGWVYEIGMDPNGVTSDLKGDSKLPLTLIVDKENNIALRHEGFEPGQESIFEETFARL